ncbi:DUF3499 domain-containing protein [Kribbia dieselivorans]|uniref:DUF3499 domain-containing protein n=1 Tax=Kribbia dieselivorans TaxID=331526 RepID=UPI0008382029|nr:DUF3499 domain-containing protein [Kribbia dieselivorans]
MSVSRTCSRNACSAAAVATLTYVYADSTCVIGPLSTFAEPHSYDLCTEHCERSIAPRGWELVRLAGDLTPPETQDDLLALANVVRRANADQAREDAQAQAPVTSSAQPERHTTVFGAPAGVRETGRRGHLRVLRDSED